MNNADICELNIRVPLSSKTNAEIICEVLKVDKDLLLIGQDISAEDNYLCAKFSASRVKDLRSGSSSFFNSFLLCEEIISNFETSDKPAS